MRRYKSLMIVVCVWLLAGCQTSVPASCAGWTKPPRVNEPAKLVRGEAPLARWVVATDKFGKKQGCWK